MTHTTALITCLQTVAHTSDSPLTQAVAALILSQADTEAVSFFRDLAQHGCISDMVSGLIYYADTHHFFDTHYDEIESLRQTLLEDIGLVLDTSHDLKNYLAWLAFEETARHLASDLGIEV